MTLRHIELHQAAHTDPSRDAAAQLSLTDSLLTHFPIKHRHYLIDQFPFNTYSLHSKITNVVTTLVTNFIVSNFL